MEDDYLLLLDAIEDRNCLSHIYDAETVNRILARLPDYAALFERIGAHLTEATGEDLKSVPEDPHTKR